MAETTKVEETIQHPNKPGVESQNGSLPRFPGELSGEIPIHSMGRPA
jgi:hypothetical protein